MKFLFLLLISFNVFAGDYLSDQRACFENVVSDLVEEGILGGDTGICIKEKINRDGDITGFDLSLSSDAYVLGEAIVKKETETKVKKLMDFVLHYEKVANNKDLTPDQLRVSVRSYADGVGGPVRMDKELQRFKTRGELGTFLESDKKSLSYIQKNVFKNDPLKGSKQSLDWTRIPQSAKSVLRNVALGKARSKAMCEAMGIQNCSNKKLEGFASPELEGSKKANCEERRVSVISIDLSNSMGHEENREGIYTPNFGFSEHKRDLEIASSVDFIHKITKVKKGEVKIHDILPAGCKRTVDETQVYLKYATKLSANFDKIKRNLPVEVAAAFISGDYEVVKQYERNFKGKDAFFGMLDLQNQDGKISSSNDFLNCFSAQKAIQHSLTHDHAHYGISAEEIVGPTSNGTLTLKSPSFSPHTILNGEKRKGIICQKCGSGVYEKEGEGFVTTFREYGNKVKTRYMGHTPMSEVAEQFKDIPSSLGGLKTLSTYAIKSCRNCDCLKKGDLDSLLLDKTKTMRLTYDAPNSLQSVQIEDPSTTCLYTPPVAHACRVAPDGSSEAEKAKNADNIPVCNFLLKETMKSSIPKTFNQIKAAMDGIKVNCESKDFKSRVQSAFCSREKVMAQNEIPLSCR